MNFDLTSLCWLLIGLLQGLILIIIAPLMAGISRQIKARMQSRRGPGILQEYRDIIKLFTRQDVAPKNAGFIFRVMPFIVIGSMLLLATILPIITVGSPLGSIADLIAIIYIFAIFRFFFSLSGLDSGSPFAGIGASRELMLGILVEPILMLALIVVAIIAGTTNVTQINLFFIEQWGGQAPTAAILALAACAFAVFIEMGKIPFDYAEAEQELQEGPLTEYSGASLALVKIGLSLKQIVIVSLFLAIFFPSPDVNIFFLLGLFLIKLFVVFVIACLIENSLCRGRFLLTSRVTWTGFGVSVLAYVFYLVSL
ncbi:respiratory chain complex I subunit 1 family protein [Orbus wheelerorum]|uniref:respiratory chain complex I subunit 1 family protein n=1 Tax=Orbus wheelerorum TaxID=3074111 RepID=UPI00370D1D3E